MKNSYYEKPKNRIFCYFGYATDSYADETLQIWSLKQMLHRELRLHGYERIMFVGLTEGIYCIDDESFGLLHGRQQKSERPQSLRATNGQQLRRTEERRVRSMTMDLNEMLRLTRQYLEDTGIKTAVIFDNALTLLTSLHRSVQEGGLNDYFHQVDGIRDARNNNVLLLLFGQGWGEAYELLTKEEHLKGIWGYLENKAQLHHIKAPNAEEIRLLCHHQRLAGYGGERLMVELSELDEMCRMIASKLLRNRSLKPGENGNWVPGELQAKELKELEKHLLQEFVLEGRKLDKEACREMCVVKQGKPALERLDELIGMAEVKETIHKFVKNYAKTDWAPQKTGLRLEQPRPQNEKRERPGLDMVLTGSPGTGKTTVARLIGEIYADLGLLPSGHLVEVRPRELMGGYVGHSEENLRKAIDRASGGILFIDEAYGLNPDNGMGQQNDYLKGMVEVLVGRMTAEDADFVVVLAGYQDKMEKFFRDANDGLKRRFRTHIHIEDYQDEELVRIFHMKAANLGWRVSQELDDVLLRLIEGYHADNQQKWGNAGTIQNLVTTMKENADSTEKCLRLEHIPKELRHYITGEREAGAEERLHEMIGLQSVKAFIEKYRNDAEFGERERKMVDHFIFAGNPGTGKTTVAEIFGMLLKQQGVLKSGIVSPVDAKSLRTKEALEEAIRNAKDRVLFIDEAYKLLGCKDLIDTIIEYTNPEKTEFPFCMICAGYEADMEAFINVNKGASRRFQIVHFDNYSPDELLQIMDLVLRKKYPKYQMTEEFRSESLRHFRVYGELIGDKYNGGYIGRYLEEATSLLYRQWREKYGKKENVPQEAYQFTKDVVPQHFCG